MHGLMMQFARRVPATMQNWQGKSGLQLLPWYPSPMQLTPLIACRRRGCEAASLPDHTSRRLYRVA
jgi:hypothetical protein